MCLRFVFLLITRLAEWLRLSRREETWKTAEILILRHQLAEHQGPGPPAGPGEPRMGIPQDPRRTGRPGSQRRGVDRVGDDPQDQRHRPRPATDRANLVTVLALPGRSRPGLRLLQRRPARRHPGPRPDRDRARGAADPHPRRHPASHRDVDRPEGPPPAHGPRRAGAPGQVHDPRPRPGLQLRIRRGPGRRRDQDRALQRGDTG